MVLLAAWHTLDPAPTHPAGRGPRCLAAPTALADFNQSNQDEPRWQATRRWAKTRGGHEEDQRDCRAGLHQGDHESPPSSEQARRPHRDVAAAGDRKAAPRCSAGAASRHEPRSTGPGDQSDCGTHRRGREHSRREGLRTRGRDTAANAVSGSGIREFDAESSFRDCRNSMTRASGRLRLTAGVWDTECGRPAPTHRAVGAFPDASRATRDGLATR